MRGARAREIRRWARELASPIGPVGTRPRKTWAKERRKEWNRLPWNMRARAADEVESYIKGRKVG